MSTNRNGWLCPKCNSYNDDQNGFCINCGSARHQKTSTPEYSAISELISNMLGLAVIAIIVLGLYFNIPSFKEWMDDSIITPINQLLSGNREDVQISPPTTHSSNESSIYDMWIPDLKGATYYQNDMNVYILWVQVQLKATDKYYIGSSWDETGNLGDQTMKEISRFMKTRGYTNFPGYVNQAVVDELADYLGYRLVPVYMGGYYNKMNSIVNNPQTQDMNSIVSNMRDNVPRYSRGAEWVQTCLKKLGYYHGTIDGKYGAATEASVKAFQRDFGFEQRDYVSLGVARTMLEACANRGYSLNDLP